MVQLLEVEAARGEGVYSAETLCCGVARLGCDDQAIIAGTMAELLVADFGAPLHSFIIPGKMHPMEEEMLAFYRPPAVPIVKPSNGEDRL
jgi:diphthine synthase